jgi:adenine deaminase
MKLIFLLAAVSLVALGQDYDIVIRGGRLIDGTGNASFLADVAIQGGRIARIGKLGEVNAKRVIDAKGLAVSPGFIDIHNHSDYTLITDGNAQSMIRQGVTSMILGKVVRPLHWEESKRSPMMQSPIMQPAGQTLMVISRGC